MFRNFAAKVWLYLPVRIRFLLIRSFQKKYTVSVVGIVTNSKDEVLILDHYFRPRYSWGLPGGFLNRDESAEMGVRREIREETGLEIDDIELVHVRSTGVHIEVIFTARSDGEPQVNSKEIRALGWFAIDQLPEMSEVQYHLLDWTVGNKVKLSDTEQQSQ